VIYSREARDRMVFMVEARPAKSEGLAPGLPIDVERVEAK
jgi:HlyD family secretion protein